jgi:hypothetical protein
MLCVLGGHSGKSPHSSGRFPGGAPVLGEEECPHMDLEFIIEEVKQAISSAEPCAVLGTSGQTIALFNYIFR